MAGSSSSAEDPIYFYGHSKGPYDFMSQWYLSDFETPDGTFNCAEQYMMYQKALLFDDKEAAVEIMAVSDPRKQKQLGRKVQNFDDDTWNAHRERIVEDGNWYKFTANKTEPELVQRLLATGSGEIAEASPRDRIWGIGFGAQNAEKNRSRWGLNLLGKALVKVRERIRVQEAAGKEA